MTVRVCLSAGQASLPTAASGRRSLRWPASTVCANLTTTRHPGEAKNPFVQYDAIVERIREVCQEKKVNVCDASLKGGMSPSALYDLIKGRTKCSKVITVKRFCEGAGITLQEFFDRPYFNDMED